MMASVDSGAPVTEYSGCSHSGPGALATIRPSQARNPSASAVEPRSTSALTVMEPSRSQQYR